MTRLKAVDVIVVGCGAVVEELYVAPLRELTRRGLVNVVSLVDPNANRAAALRRRFPSAKICPDLMNALSDRKAPLVVIASPPGFHADQAVTALESGGDVLCEKPMALTSRQCELMLSTARRTGGRLFVGLPRRLFPVLQELRTLVRSNALGSKLEFSYHEGGRYDWPINSITAFRRSSSGGGVLMDKGSHVIDFLIQIFGLPIDVQYSDDALDGGIETNCRLVWKGEKAQGTVTLSWDQDLANQLKIVGEKGAVTWKVGEIDRYFHLRPDGKRSVIRCAPCWPSDLQTSARFIGPRDYYDCIQLQLIQALRALALNESSPIESETAAHSIAIIEGCYKGSVPLEQRWLPDIEAQVMSVRHWAVPR